MKNLWIDSNFFAWVINSVNKNQRILLPKKMQNNTSMLKYKLLYPNLTGKKAKIPRYTNIVPGLAKPIKKADKVG